MTQLRKECGDARATDRYLPRDTALYLIRAAVSKRRSLIYGQLDNNRGQHCAIGCFFEDHPKTAIDADLIDEVAAVNDSVPPSATARERWKFVQSWLRLKIAAMTKRTPNP